MGDISVIIPTKNAGVDFDDLLQSIRSQQTDREIELVVIDSGSTDETLAIARDQSDEIIRIDPEEFHHAETRNRGAQRANGDVLVFTVQDARPVNGRWLTNLVEPLEHTDVGITYGRQIAYPDAKPMDEFFYSYFYPDDRAVLTETDAVNTREFYLDNIYISDVSAAMDRSVWEELQFQSEIAMSEDKDFALRALRNGYRIAYEPSATVYHSHDYSLESLFRRRYADGKAYAQIATDGHDTFVSNGIEYVLKELHHLITTGAVHWIPYALAYDLTHFVSFQLGKYHDWIQSLIGNNYNAQP